MFLSEMINKEEFAMKKAEIEECVEKLKKRNNSNAEQMYCRKGLAKQL